MAWIHIPSIPSTFSPDTAGFNLGFDSPASPSGPFATSSGTSTASKSSASVKSMACSMTLPSGTISNPSTVDPGVERWIFSVLASRANLTQTRGYEKAPQMIGTFSPIPSESLGKWDRDSSCWRTCQGSLWDLIDGHHMGAPWSDSWPRSGMTRNGELYPLPTQAHRTSVSDGGLWPSPRAEVKLMECTAPPYKGRSHNWDLGAALIDAETGASGRQWPGGASRKSAKSSWHIPTPTSADVYTGNLESSQQSDDSMHSVSLPDFVGRFPTPVADGDRQTNYKQGVAARMWPTPTSSERPERDLDKRIRDKRQIGISEAVRMFPTPRAGKTTDEDEESWLARHADGKVATPPLALAARMLPTPSSGGDSGGPHGIRGGSWTTPQSQDAKHSGYGTSDKGRDLLSVEVVGQMLPTPHSSMSTGPGRQGREGGDNLQTAVNGSLSPDWVSWLMGLPVSWTSLEPLPREEYDQWLQMQRDGTWWAQWWGPWWFDCPSIATGIKDRVSRLKCLGNGIVPASLALFLRGTR